MQPTIGRILIYKISPEEAEQINRRRTEIVDWPLGAQAHIGNSAQNGDEYPLVVVRVWPDEFGPGIPGVNGQLLLDGNDTLWLTSVAEGTAPGTWHWPERV